MQCGLLLTGPCQSQTTSKESAPEKALVGSGLANRRPWRAFHPIVVRSMHFYCLINDAAVVKASHFFTDIVFPSSQGSDRRDSCCRFPFLFLSMDSFNKRPKCKSRQRRLKGLTSLFRVNTRCGTYGGKKSWRERDQSKIDSQCHH